MANWQGMVLTTKGRTLQAKVEAGTTLLNLTKIKLGDGVISGSQTLEGLTDLVSPKQIIGITTINPQSTGICKITGTVTNVNLETGYNLKELGLFATDPDDGEILYAITTDSNFDYLQAKGGATIVSQEFNLSIAISNTSDVTASIDVTGLLTVNSATVLISQLIAAHNTATDAHADLLNLRKNNTPYVIGDCKNSPNLPSWAYLECTVGGTTASTEPTYPAVGNNIVDGTVTWIVRDKRQADAQFDVSTKLATTAFVKNVGFQYSGVIGLTASRNALASDIGNSIFIANAGLTYTLLTPNALIGSTGAGGKTITFTTTSYGVILVAGSGVTLCLENGTVVGSMQVPVGVTITLYSGNGVQWRAIGGSGSLAGSGVFAASLNQNGYQKLPSGKIEQWGLTPVIASGANMTITLPIAFPHSYLNFEVTYTDFSSDISVGTSAIAQVRAATLSNFTIRNLSSLTAQYHWKVIGY